MKNNILIFILLLVATINKSYSQETVHFDRVFHYRTDDPKSTNKREYITTDSIIEIKDYNKHGLFRTGKFYGFTNLYNLEEFIYFNTTNQYDRNPKLKTENREGTVTYYNKDGHKMSEQFLVGEQTKQIQLWNNQKPFLTNGSGTFKCDSEKKNEKIVRIYKDSLEIEGFIVRESRNDTIYIKKDTKAYPKSGLQSFYQQIAKNFKYPSFAQLLGIDKKITISFVVDENGKLTDFEPLNSTSLNFEKKAIRRLEKLPKWNPATRNGKGVKTKFQIPLTFKH